MMELLTEVKYKIIYQIFIKDFLINVNWKFDDGVKIYATYLIKKNLIKVTNVAQEYIIADTDENNPRMCDYSNVF